MKSIEESISSIESKFGTKFTSFGNICTNDGVYSDQMEYTIDLSGTASDEGIMTVYNRIAVYGTLTVMNDTSKSAVLHFHVFDELRGSDISQYTKSITIYEKEYLDVFYHGDDISLYEIMLKLIDENL